MNKIENRKLSYKIGVAISLLLIICLTVMIIISAILTSRSLSQTVSGELDSTYQDEIGNLAVTFGQMASRLREIINDIADALNRVAHDLSHTLLEINEVSETVSSNADQI